MSPSGTTPEGVRWLRYTVPLRRDFLATLELPRDLTGAEAERLAAFLQTLATPSEQPSGLMGSDR